MKAAIIVFSPSGNTVRVGEIIKENLEKNSIRTQLVKISQNEEYFFTTDKREFLKKIVSEHDILFIGAPVYAHHLQYHVIDLINNLPKPMTGWGKLAIPFITYGGINSGIALDEAGRLLKKSGRMVFAGLKVSAPHYMTKAILGKVHNDVLNEQKITSTVERLIDCIKHIDLNTLKDNSKYLKYQNIVAYLQANLIYIEKVCHEKRYPKVLIDNDKCLRCGKCIEVCPVCCIVQTKDGSIEKNDKSQCIHCFNCIYSCSQKAIYPLGNIEKAKEFITDVISKPKEEPDTCLYMK